VLFLPTSACWNPTHELQDVQQNAAVVSRKVSPPLPLFPSLALRSIESECTCLAPKSNRRARAPFPPPPPFLGLEELGGAEGVNRRFFCAMRRARRRKPFLSPAKPADRPRASPFPPFPPRVVLDPRTLVPFLPPRFLSHSCDRSKGSGSVHLFERNPCQQRRNDGAPAADQRRGKTMRPPPFPPFILPGKGGWR